MRGDFPRQGPGIPLSQGGRDRHRHPEIKPDIQRHKNMGQKHEEKHTGIEMELQRHEVKHRGQERDRLNNRLKDVRVNSPQIPKPPRAQVLPLHWDSRIPASPGEAAYLVQKSSVSRSSEYCGQVLRGPPQPIGERGVKAICPNLRLGWWAM